MERLNHISENRKHLSRNYGLFQGLLQNYKHSCDKFYVWVIHFPSQSLSVMKSSSVYNVSVDSLKYFMFNPKAKMWTSIENGLE